MKKLSILFALFTAIYVVSCDSKDAFDQEGLMSIYMPQASMLNGGFSNLYPVPFENGNIENYTLEETTKQMKIVLGVKNSGRSKNGFSVNVVADMETTNSVVADQQVENAVMLPEDTYSFPQSVSVEPGNNEKSFFLHVNMKKIADEYPEYFEKKMVLAIKITNNSNINSKLATTIIVIDGSKLLPTPPPPPIDTMLKGDAWKILPQNIGGVTGDTDIKIIDGRNIHYSSGAVAGRFNHVIYQPVEVVAGETYTYDMMIDITGQAWGWIQLHISPREPIASEDFNENRVFDVSNKITSPMSSLMSEASNIQDKKTFTATQNGVVYFVLKIGSWDNNFENLILSDLVFKKAPTLPKPPTETMLKGDAWKILPQGIDGGISNDAEIKIVDGKNIYYSNGNERKKYNHVIYQSVEVEGGKTYTYDMMLDFKKEKAWGWIQVYISSQEPTNGGDFNDNKVYDFSGNANPPTSGLMSDFSSIKDKTTFTPSQSGTIYFIIKIGCWDDNFEDLTISELNFKEKL
ncbi:DUF1735 domain-containing protein [Capnocytophaga catalasegens]|uniref:BT-3987-like N-terminal domain-containing protein n=1 Tax=Capnocytophaga catalasegens TaxID=1004260 RepID=A0AAV5AS06_9FLAO|nr:DUF1735 domain-containing protein [Capnocytophaga catalasegens]GIZ15679.1 hypothetical protein RCZ03_16790 [Capnocytophaga catalasegens]GJM50066.1 hypothetical protein RCZ15_10400 [Capnocytophaga catalasegens]GJM53109.1 hypothetical protein RCZ16_14260 [Capnocytophaga catalasegens]